MLLKSKWWLYVECDNGSGSIKYYNTKNRKILTSQNFGFLIPTPPGPTEHIEVVLPNVPFKGECGEGKQQLDAENEQSPIVDKEWLPSSAMTKMQDDATGKQEPSSTVNGKEWKKETLPNLKRKQWDGETSDLWEPRKTCGKHIDYCHLNNPFSEDEEDDEANYINNTAIENILEHDERKMLQEAKDSPEWEHWENEIKAELNQLAQKGTWTYHQGGGGTGFFNRMSKCFFWPFPGPLPPPPFHIWHV